MEIKWQGYRLVTLWFYKLLPCQCFYFGRIVACEDKIFFFTLYWKLEGSNFYKAAYLIKKKKLKGSIGEKSIVKFFIKLNPEFWHKI